MNVDKTLRQIYLNINRMYGGMITINFPTKIDLFSSLL